MSTLNNLLGIFALLSLITFDTTPNNYTVFIIFNYFTLEKRFVLVWNALAGFTPRLEAIGSCEQLTQL